MTVKFTAGENKKESVVKKSGGEETTMHETDQTELVAVPEAHSVIEVGVHTTVNTGNYNSIKMFVGIRRPCEPTEEDENATYEYCKAWAGEKLQDLYGEYIEG